MNTLSPSQVLIVARVCHEANRAWCAAIGDASQKPWDEAEEWQRESAGKGVEFKLANPGAAESAQHDSWVADKLAAGWKFGPVKDADKKEHPCLVPYADLPIEQRLKDALFVAIVEALAQIPKEAPPASSAPPSPTLPPSLSPPLAVPEVRIHLLNRAWRWGSPQARCQGYSGKPYGSPSRYHAGYGCHYVEITLADYEKASQDIAKAAHLSSRTWEVKVVAVEGERGRQGEGETGSGAKPGAAGHSSGARSLAPASPQGDRGGDQQTPTGSQDISPGSLERSDRSRASEPEGSERGLGTTEASRPPGETDQKAAGVGGSSAASAAAAPSASSAQSAVPLPVLDPKMPFTRLVKIAQTEGAPWKGITTAKEMRASIEAHRVDVQKKLIATKPQGALA